MNPKPWTLSALFLDDDPVRRALIAPAMQCDAIGTTYVTRAADAIDQLSRHRFEFVFLDHDLGMQGGREENGMEVVRWIVEHKPDIHHIIVHTWNIPAAEEMTERLRDAGYRVVQRPFGPWLYPEVKE